jgi:hypothetical protein
VYATGEASADTRALVEAFLRQDPEFAGLLQGRGAERLLRQETPSPPCDHETRALRRTKRLLHGWDWTFFLAMLFSGFAFGRVLSDTSWDVSPRNFTITASIAVAFWVGFFATTAWMRREMYRMGSPGR